MSQAMAVIEVNEMGTLQQALTDHFGVDLEVCWDETVEGDEAWHVCWADGPTPAAVLAALEANGVDPSMFVLRRFVGVRAWAWLLSEAACAGPAIDLSTPAVHAHWRGRLDEIDGSAWGDDVLSRAAWRLIAAVDPLDPRPELAMAAASFRRVSA